MGMAASIFPLYTVEITEPKYKSTVGSVFGVAVGAGVVIAVFIHVLYHQTSNASICSLPHLRQSVSLFLNGTGEFKSDSLLFGASLPY